MGDRKYDDNEFVVLAVLVLIIGVLTLIYVLNG
jgi:hypothetical protein